MFTVLTSVLPTGTRCGIAAVVAGALMCPALAAQSTTSESGRKPTGEQATRTIGSGAITSAEALARDPRAHYGKVVMVQADIQRVLGAHLLLLDEDAAFAGPDILVIVPSGTKGLTAESEVRIAGKVRPYVRAELEREFDWFGRDAAVDIDLRGRPVIVADSVQSAKEGELAGAILQVPTDTASQPRPIRVTAGELAEHSELYRGKRVSVYAEVEDVHNRQLFTLDEDRLFVGPDVIVYARDGRAIVGDDQMVTVTGVVRNFIDTDLFGTATWFDPWFNDLDAAGRGLVRSRPVIVADSVLGPNGTQLYHSSQEQTARAAQGEGERTVGTGGTAGDDGSLSVGRDVTLTGTIQSIATKRAFWLAVEGRPEAVMVIVDAARMASLPGDWTPAANQRVEVEGAVKEVPGHEGHVKVTDWGLPPEHAKRFSEQRTYVYADRVTPVPR
jgi:hypothetical protein